MASSIIGVGRERKGTMFLRSDEMNYGRAVLNSTWHQAREGEPRDYDINRDPVRDLLKSTYHRLGTFNNSAPSESTYMDHFKEKPVSAKVSSALDEGEKERERDAKRSKHDYVVIPRHNSAQLPNHYVTTHKADYISLYDKNNNSNAESSSSSVTTTKAVLGSTVDHDAAVFKRCMSQFTDTTNHRRSGRNTWQDESGIYANGILKSACPYYSRTYTLMPGGVRPDAAY